VSAHQKGVKTGAGKLSREKPAELEPGANKRRTKKSEHQQEPSDKEEIAHMAKQVPKERK
jgi:hypothetical protein